MPPFFFFDNCLTEFFHFIYAGLTTHALYGRGKSWTRSDIERFLRQMVFENYLKEEMYVNGDITIAYVKLGDAAQRFMTTGGTVIN